ncbi:hypothetical protein [Lacticaseibacillus daqingensis]|uniref:hypothetical protein n=1 Tax=Lacticaseibacillus daqingensis TaxID=2486014 RepID=UPI000F798E1E|nr:hypothetical protein [Lacticaseibacillus daqingensis]
MKQFWSNICRSVQNRTGKIWGWAKTPEGLILVTLLCPPIGAWLIMRDEHFNDWFRFAMGIIVVLVTTILLSLWLGNTGQGLQVQKLEAKSEQLKAQKADISSQYSQISDSYDRLKTQHAAYQKKMSPYEKTATADEQAVQKVQTLFDALPMVTELSVEQKDQLLNARQSYDTLTDSQKVQLDTTRLTQLEQKMPEIEKAAADKAAADKAAAEQAAAAAAAKAEEERKGYETGTTYDQLARTPDSYIFKKVKFSGKVIQIIEGDDSVQARLAVGGNYDQVILCEWKDTAVSSRVLEDDQITVFGTSAGLLTYKSTMGGKITIPSVSVDKIAQ